MREYLERIEPKRAGYRDNKKNKDRPLTIGVQKLQSQHYQNANHQSKHENAKRDVQIKKRTDREIYWRYTILWIIS